MSDSTADHSPGRDIRHRAFLLACRVVRVCGGLYQQGPAGRVMANQLVACSTSVPAMLEEARAAESRRDFVSKCSIGLKEARETLVRLRICESTGYGPKDELKSLICETGEVVSILGAIVRNARAHDRTRTAAVTQVQRET